MPIPGPVPRSGVLHSRVSVATARSGPISASAARPFDPPRLRPRGLDPCGYLTSMGVPDTRYAITPESVYLAYQSVGEGPIDASWQNDPMFGNVEDMWETVTGDSFRQLSSFARLILHDPRGTGLSSRNVPPPNLETRAADLGVILDTVGSERPCSEDSAKG